MLDSVIYQGVCQKGESGRQDRKTPLRAEDSLRSWRPLAPLRAVPDTITRFPDSLSPGERQPLQACVLTENLVFVLSTVTQNNMSIFKSSCRQSFGRHPGFSCGFRLENCRNDDPSIGHSTVWRCTKDRGRPLVQAGRRPARVPLPPLPWKAA